MESTALELVLPWLTAQELASVARVSKSMASAVRTLTLSRIDDGAQGKERWKVPILNQVDNHLYPCFQYKRHSEVVHCPSEYRPRTAWGSVTDVPLGPTPYPTSSASRARKLSRNKQFLSCSGGTAPDDLKYSEVQEVTVQLCRSPDFVDVAVGCRCDEKCGSQFLSDAKLLSSLGSRQEGSGECTRTMKRKTREEQNECRLDGGNSPQHRDGNLVSETGVAQESKPCHCGKTFGGQLAYGEDSKLQVLTSPLRASPSCSRFSTQLPGEFESEDGQDLEEGPPLILECGNACSCGSNCGLRVSQHGLSVRVSIVRHRLKGWCLHAAQPISVGSFVCEYAGEMITTTEARLRQRLYETETEVGRRKHGSSLVVLKEHLPSGRVCLRLNVDGTVVGNVSRFISHSCDGGNLYPCLIRTAGSIIPKLGLFARKDVEEGEELSYNYGADSAKGGAYRLCFCGTAACQGMLPSEAT